MLVRMIFGRNALSSCLVLLTLTGLLFMGEVLMGLLWMNPLVPGVRTMLVGWIGYGVFAGVLLLIAQRLDRRRSGVVRAVLVVGLGLLLPIKLGLSHPAAALAAAGMTVGLVGLVSRRTSQEADGRVLAILFLLLVGLSPDWFDELAAVLSREILYGAMGAVSLAAGLWLGTSILSPLEDALWRHRVSVVGGMVLVVFGAAFVWSGSAGVEDFEPYFSGTVPHVRTSPDRSPEDLPNIILISVDTLRRDMVPPHAKRSYAREALGDLYRDSVRFERMFSTSDWTLPAHASLFTGLLPVEHGAVRARGSRIRADRPTYTQILNNLGYRTAAFTDGGFVSVKLGFGRGFDHVWEQQFESGDFLPGLIRLACPNCGNPDSRKVAPWLGSTRKEYRYFSRNLERARAWIERNEDRDRPFFMFLHTFQVHDYWDLYPDGTKRLARDRPRLHSAVTGEEGPTPRKLQKEMGMTPREYAGMKLEGGPLTDQRIKRLSEWVERRRRARWFLYLYETQAVYDDMKRFMGYLRKQGYYRDSFVVFLSDHGEGFHLGSGAWGHGSRQLDEILVRVPTWIKPPGGRDSDRTVRGLYQITDVFPLLFRDMGLNPADVLLKPTGPKPAGDLFESGRTVVSGSSGSRSTLPKLFVRSRCRRLIHDTETDQTNVNTVESEACTSETLGDTEVLHRELHERLRRLEEGPNPFRKAHFAMDPELVRELEGLGYL